MHGNTLIIDAFWVDNKPFPTAQATNFGDGRAFHDYYCGTARYLGWMDLVLLKDIIKKNHINHIILHNLDVLGQIAEETKEIKVCIAYEYHKIIFHSLEQNKLIAYPISDKEIKQGIESFKADFDSFKQLALEQYKEQQKLEREQQKTMNFRGMSR